LADVFGDIPTMTGIEDTTGGKIGTATGTEGIAGTMMKIDKRSRKSLSNRIRRPGCRVKPGTTD